MRQKQCTYSAIFSIAMFVAYPFFCLSQQIDSSDVALLRQRITEFSSADPPSPSDVQEMIKSLKPDGSWPDIDYQSIEVASWPPYGHLTNYVLPMVKAYANRDSPLYHDKQLAEAIHRSLDFWLNHNFTSRNWWQNDIGVPKTLTDILIMMDGEVTLQEFLKALNQMRGSYITQTGQNKVWRAEIQLKLGLLQYDRGRNNMLGSPERRMQEASKVLRDEVVVRAKEGIQPDWSFHQHGVQQQFGNYGLSYATSQSQWAYILSGTPFQYSADEVTILSNYVLKGLSRVIWKGSMDISGCGRQIKPGAQVSKGAGVVRVLKLMKKVDPGKSAQYQAVLDFNTGVKQSASTPQGNKYFWRSDLMVDRTAGSDISIRMCSKKIQSTESGNGENLRAAHLSDGATYIYQSGHEYQNIFPVWDWHRVPGTTAYVEGDLPKVSWGGLHNGSDFVGGVSDSVYGVATMLFKRNELTAQKSWFFVSNGMVCLGTGINSMENKAVATTLNQCLLRGPVTIQNGKKKQTLNVGQTVDGPGIQWVYHDGTGYVFLQNEQVHVGTEAQTGSWERVYEGGSQKPVSHDVFNLWIDHGSKPQKGSYAYMVMPDVKDNRLLEKMAKNPGVKVLQNTEALQAIQDSKMDLTQAVFYEAGSVKVSKSVSVSVDVPCLLMVEKLPGGLKVTVSVPPELNSEINLSLTGQYSGDQCTYNVQKNQSTVKFDLPEGMYAGESVSRILMGK